MTDKKKLEILTSRQNFTPTAKEKDIKTIGIVNHHKKGKRFTHITKLLYSFLAK